jgi:hypothetical protein
VPVFDNDQGSPVSPDPSKRNASVPGSFNLTPGSSYSCQTAGGELSWNASTRVLTVRGTIFIDGSAQVQNGALNTYKGQGSLYLSGTLLVKNSKLCAHVAAGGCDSAGWDPNTTMLVVVANGPGGIQVPVGDSVQLVSSTFQGALYGTNAVEIDTTSQAIGPIVRQHRLPGPVNRDLVSLGHRRARGHAGQPDGLRAAQPAAALWRLREGQSTLSETGTPKRKLLGTRRDGLVGHIPDLCHGVPDFGREGVQRRRRRLGAVARRI